MNGGADLGGMMGFGPVIEEAGEPNFHAEWEARVMGMVVALGASGQWNIDQSRSARETMPPATYMTMPYYAIWLDAAERLMLERGMITREERTTGQMKTPPVPVRATLTAETVPAALAKGGPADRPAQGRATFAVGDMVHTLNEHPEGHTRLPRYARDKTGQITKVHGYHVYPDAAAQGREQAHWLYQVRFTARDLWGQSRSAADRITLDLWEPYLRPLP